MNPQPRGCEPSALTTRPGFSSWNNGSNLLTRNWITQPVQAGRCKQSWVAQLVINEWFFFLGLLTKRWEMRIHKIHKNGILGEVRWSEVRLFKLRLSIGWISFTFSWTPTQNFYKNFKNSHRYGLSMDDLPWTSCSKCTKNIKRSTPLLFLEYPLLCINGIIRHYIRNLIQVSQKNSFYELRPVDK